MQTMHKDTPAPSPPSAAPGAAVPPPQAPPDATRPAAAEAPEAAHLLSQAAGELRRTLEQQGLNIVRIEVGTAGSDAAGTGTGAAGSDQRNGRRGPSRQTGDPAGAETDLPIADRTIELPN